MLSLFFAGMVVSHPDPESMIRDKYHHYNQLMANNFQTWEHGPNFDTKLPQNVTAIQGKTTMLVCRVFDLGNKTVSPLFITCILLLAFLEIDFPLTFSAQGIFIGDPNDYGSAGEPLF